MDLPTMQQDKETNKKVIFDLNLKLSTQIEALIKYLGADLDDYSFAEDGIRGPALCHAGSNPTGWSFYSDSSRTWKCWTHHCEEKYGKSCIGLIRAVLNCEFPEACKKAEEFISASNITDEHIAGIEERQKKNRKKAKENYWKEHTEPRQVFPESILSNLASATKFADERALDPLIFIKYGIGIATKGDLNGRVIIPVRNISNEIVGFSGRLLNYKKGDIKWFHYPTKRHGDGHLKTSIQLFNLHNAFTYNVLDGESTYVLTEGPFDTLKLEMAGIHNSVSTFGNTISDGQIEILKQIGATQIYIAYDGDEPGKEGAKEAKKKLEKNLLSVGIIDLTDAYPHWPEDSHGGLDWANPFVTTESIIKIMEKYT